MSPGGWEAFYATEMQGVWALWLVPLVFLAYLAVARPDLATALDPMRATFMRRYAVVFTLETVLDPLAGGPLVRWLGLDGTTIATVVMVTFVLLGDFRVFLLVFALATDPARPLDGRRVLAAAGDAARWTLVVPVVALVIDGTLRALRPGVPAQTIWLVYELSFLALALWMRARLLPARLDAGRERLHDYLRTVLAYVALYYALWAAADVLILAGVDLGWALRIVPNQLYYAFWVPTVYLLFFSPRWAATSASTQAAR